MTLTTTTGRPVFNRVEIARITDLCTEDPQAAAMLEVITGRAARWTAQPTVCAPGDFVDWWHVCWERLSDVAFTQSLQPTEQRGRWLVDEVLRICELPTEEWNGPWFRPKVFPPVGYLETAHVALAITIVLELCPQLFDAAQRRLIDEALVTKGLDPCRRFLEANEKAPAPGTGTDPLDINNWYLVLLDGFAAAALATGSTHDIATLPERFRRGAELCLDDSYAESLQYWGYATLHLTHVYELMTAAGIDGVGPDWLAPVGRALPWVAQSVMFEQQNSVWGQQKYMAMLNFADSALTGRPPSDVLLCLSRVLADRDTPSAGLARWLFDLTYSDLELEPSEMPSFGFFNQISWRSLNHLTGATEPKSPWGAGLPTTHSFSTGTVVTRDRWQDTRTVLAVRNGHDDLPTVSHRHADEASFILGHRREVFFTDPGHCCYRLQAQKDARDSTAHNTWSFTDPTSGHILKQRLPLAEGALGSRSAPRTVTGPSGAGPVTIFGADVADAYDPALIIRARRSWICWLPNLVLIVDDIETRRPLVVHSAFVINNRDNRLRTNRATDNRLVFRRGESAAKFFQLSSETDERPSGSPVHTQWSALHDVYDPHPNAAGQGKEGSGEVHTFATATAGYRHRAVYSIVVDAEPAIKNWHVMSPDSDTVDVQLPDDSKITFNVKELLKEAR